MDEGKDNKDDGSDDAASSPALNPGTTSAPPKKGRGGSRHNPVPPAVLASPQTHVLARERVTSLPVPISRLRPEFLPLSGGGGEGETLGDDSALLLLLRTYLAATMRCFARTPQARLMRRMVAADPRARDSFSSAYLARCGFDAGDRVCGVYVVRGRKVGGAGGREAVVLLDLSPPAGWRVPVVEGCLVCGFVRDGGGEAVRFVNETVMWRGKDGEPTLLEGRAGRWLHALMVRWLVVSGIDAVTGEEK